MTPYELNMHEVKARIACIKRHMQQAIHDGPANSLRQIQLTLQESEECLRLMSNQHPHTPVHMSATNYTWER